MTNYIDLWTGFHLWLATLGFIGAEKWISPKFPNVHSLFVAFVIVIVGALIYELIADVGRQWLWEKLDKKPPYKDMERCLVNSFFDMVAALIACGITAILIGG